MTMLRFEDCYQNIGKQVKKYRLACGYSQEELSELLQKNLKYIGHIERCERKISTTKIIELIDFFKVQPVDFYNFDEKFSWD